MNSEEQKRRELSSPVHTEWKHQGKIISLKTETFEEEERAPFDIVIHPGAVVMIPVFSDGKLVLVKQWRRATQKILIELPAGTLEPGEKPAETAQRELQEEIGFFAKKLTAKKGFFTAPGFCNEYLHLYLAEDLVESKKKGEDTHLIDIIFLSLSEALHKIQTGEIEDAKTIIGIYTYAREKRI